MVTDGMKVLSFRGDGEVFICEWPGGSVTMATMAIPGAVRVRVASPSTGQGLIVQGSRRASGERGWYFEDQHDPASGPMPPWRLRLGGRLGIDRWTMRIEVPEDCDVTLVDANGVPLPAQG